MDRLSSVMVRGSLLWLLGGVFVGAAMLTDRSLPGNWRVWAQPSHIHMLFVGWFLQFALGVAYWLLPRKRTTARPLGYDERLALAAVIGLNLGLLLRVVAEPVERTGHDGTATFWALTLSAVLQVAAVAIFVSQLWPRVGARPRTRAQHADGRQDRLTTGEQLR
jgi:hypothetical protein